MKKAPIYILLALLAMSFTASITYPITGYEATGIARLLYLERRAQEGDTARALRAGSFLNWNDIQLNLTSRPDLADSLVMQPTPGFQESMSRLFPNRGRGYGIAVMDMTDPNNLKYASENETSQYQPGSVGKLAVLTAFFTELAKICPDDWNTRTNLMKSKRVRSSYWGTGDHHTIPVYDIEKDRLTKRRVVASDEFSLYEWVDHMVSVSNNGAASVVWREALLMNIFGDEYFGLTEEVAEQYLKDTPRGELTDRAINLVNDPLRELGIGHDEWRLGSLFTNAANKYVGNKGGSIGTPKGLMKFLLALEQGKVVDLNSSQEMKRLMYMTDRRIRYAYNRALDSAAVYYKSGSLYSNDRSKPGGGKYAGNVYNYMNSVIIVEHPDGTKYITCLMSNILNKNSANDHSYLAGTIDKAIRAQYATE